MKNKAFSPRRRKGRKGRKEILTCLLLLSVFAVKILGELASKKIHWPRTNTEKKNKSILTAKTQRAQRKARIHPPAYSRVTKAQGRVIRTFLLLLSVLSVFAVKILGELASKEEAFATDELGITHKKN